MNKINIEKELVLIIWKIALFIFLVAVFMAIVWFVLGFLDANGIIKPPIFLYYALEIVVVYLFTLAAQLATLVLVIVLIGMLSDKRKAYEMFFAVGGYKWEKTKI